MTNPKKHKHQWYKTQENLNYTPDEYYEFTCGYSGCGKRKRMLSNTSKWKYYGKDTKRTA